jgi:hypothetical protein
MTARNYRQEEADFQERQAQDSRDRLTRWLARPKQGDFSEEYASILRSRIAMHEQKRDAGREEQKLQEWREAKAAQAEADTAPFGGGPLPEHVTELEPGAYLIEAPVISEAEHAEARAEFLEWLAGGREVDTDREPGS